MFTTKKIAVVSVINDLVSDSRVNRSCNVLAESGYEVVLIGRKLRNSPQLPEWPFKAIRMRLLFTSGPLFYVFFNVRLFFRLLFTKSDLLLANDLDTLWPNYMVSKLKNVPLLYDSHELFCEVPELSHTPLKKSIWKFLEKKILPRLKYCITVNQSIADIFNKMYNTKFEVIRNIPESVLNFEKRSRQQLNLPTDKKIILLQGAGINIDRGAEELVEAMCYLESVILLIIGSGDVWPKLKHLVDQKSLQDKVKLLDRMPKTELMHYTYNADIGISIDKNTNPNYYNSLPNKIFDYLQAGIPILASRLPEIEKVIVQYNVGTFIDSHDPKKIAEAINNLLFSGKMDLYRNNAVKAAAELNWENEKQKYLKIIEQIKN